MSHMEITRVSAGIGNTTIVHDINFTITPGTMTALVGVNGAGKSTLLRALAGITKPHHGEVTLDGESVYEIRPRRRAQLLTLVGQEEIVAEAIAMVGLTDVADRPCDQLSGGQRRRALLARGFAQHTDMVMLDEPTNHLDVHHQLHLLKVLRESGRTILATIHDLDLAMSHFDQVVVLYDGTMLCAGPPEEVLIPDNLRVVFDVRAYIARLPEAISPHLIIDSL